MRETHKDISKIKYIICGDGFYHERIQQWITEMKLDNIVTLYGYCTNIPQIVGCADAMIFPSKREGLGMAGLEALSMGIPVIASDNRGTREYMEHGKNGFVYSFDDVDGFVEGIQLIMQLSSQKRKEMQISCIDSVKPFDKLYAHALMKRIYLGVDNRIGRESHEK